jgi:hypothetical protein
MAWLHRHKADAVPDFDLWFDIGEFPILSWVISIINKVKRCYPEVVELPPWVWLGVLYQPIEVPMIRGNTNQWNVVIFERFV